MLVSEVSNFELFMCLVLASFVPDCASGIFVCASFVQEL